MMTVGRSSLFFSRREVALLAGLFLVLAAVSGCAGPPKLEKPEAGPVFYPPPPDPPRIQYLTSFRTNRSIGERPGTFASFVLGSDAERIKSINKPYGVAAHGGVIYVADLKWRKVFTLDLERNKFEVFPDTGQGKLRYPVGIFIEPDGTKYIADANRRQVVVFGPDNRFKMALGDGEGTPVDVAVSGDRVYVNDTAKNRIRVYDKEAGEFLFEFGSKGQKEGEFAGPANLAVDGEGNLYVSDLFNYRVQKFDRDGKFLSAIGQAGDIPGTFARPKGIAVSREGHLYVVDASFQNVQLFNKEGQVLMVLGEPGNAPGKMYLPARVSISYDLVPYFQQYVEKGFEVQYIVLVTNQFGDHSVSVYGFGALKE